MHSTPHVGALGIDVDTIGGKQGVMKLYVASQWGSDSFHLHGQMLLAQDHMSFICVTKWF